MARDLTERDLSILKKLAPEYEGEFCPGSGHVFHSVLPPVSNHFAEDEDDFRERIGRLSDEEWAYLADLMLQGEESMGCLPDEDVDAVLAHIRDAVSGEVADRIRTIRALTSCGVL
jgi:hypothetical protein